MANKKILVTGIATIGALAGYNRFTVHSFQKKQHVMIHVDLNKTIIMSDAVQDLGFKKSLNTILADTSCWGHIIECEPSNINAINNKLWIPIMIETNKEIVKQHSSSSPLITYGDFVREQLPYTQNAVDPHTKAKRKYLRQQFTYSGYPGEQYAHIVDMLYNKLHQHLIIPAFLHFIDYLYTIYNNDEKRSFSILFRTFGTDLPQVINEFNVYCESKGYHDICVNLNDTQNCGVMIYNKNELYLVVGTFEMDPRYERITENMTLDTLNDADRLSFYDNNDNVQCIVKGYENIYAFIKKQSVLNKKTMAIRDDYCYWALNGESSEFGKTMIMDREDVNIHQLFFDDCACYVLNTRDVNNPSAHISFEEIKDVHAVHCNSYEIMTNDNYFTDYLQQALTT